MLGIALGHLALGRVHLHRCLLDGTGSQSSRAEAAATEIEEAIDGLRRAGDVGFVAKGLLSRARFFHDREALADARRW